MNFGAVKTAFGIFKNLHMYEEAIKCLYVSNNKEEAKRDYINKDEDIKIIRVKIDYQIKSFKGLFDNCKCIESINFKKFFRNNIDDMSLMFYECISLKELNLNNSNTINVTDMSDMLYKCFRLKKINFNNFHTNNVTMMSYMFNNCS